MTTSSSSLLMDVTSDANFRAWGSGIASGLQAVGLVKTSNTGQINWSTVTRGTATSGAAVSQGYEIYRLNDSLQSTQPVFIKVEYGTSVRGNSGVGGASWAAPAMWVTVGTGTNGAATLTGSVSSRIAMTHASNTQTGQPSTAAATQYSTCYFSGDTSSVCMAIGIDTTIASAASGGVFFPLPYLLVIERTRNSSGTATADGLIFLTSCWPYSDGNWTTIALQARAQTISFTGSGVGSLDTFWPFSWPGLAFGSGSIGNTVDIYPLVVVSPLPEPNALSVLGCYQGDLAMGSTIQITSLGSSHTYIGLTAIGGTDTTAHTAVDSRILTGAVLMRYE